MKRKIEKDYLYHSTVYLLFSAACVFVAIEAKWNDRSFLVMFGFSLFAVLFILFSAFESFKYKLFKSDLKNPLFEMTIEDDLINDIKEKRASVGQKLDKIAHYALLFGPVGLALFVIVGVIIDNLFLALVLPIFLVTLFLIYFFISEYYKSGSKYNDEEYLENRKKFIIGKKTVYAYGVLYIYNTYGLNFKLIDGAFTNYYGKGIKLGKFKVKNEEMFETVSKLLLKDFKENDEVSN